MFFIGLGSLEKDHLWLGLANSALLTRIMSVTRDIESAFFLSLKKLNKG